MKSITTDELEVYFEKILEMLKNNGLNTIPLKTDLYWMISSTEWEVENENYSVVVGSLSDDNDNLCRILDESAIISSLDVDRVAAILKYIGHYINH